ncbi:MAG TPA: hypothetical protein VLR92_07105 [Blastocatellia bacterium]|nr:hypothetical protein [Blastocatellia bacterium]
MEHESNVRFSENIISLIVDGLHDEASATIVRAGQQLSVNQARRLTALVRIDKDKPEGIAEISESNRRAYRKNGTWLAYVYLLGTELMDIERWAAAEVALDEVIALSKVKAEFYFLDDAHLRRALCLKYLGRRREMEALKAETSPTAKVFICRDDLGGCVELGRDDIV